MGVISDWLGTLRETVGLGPKTAKLTLSWAPLTAPRTVEFQDKAGTIALLDDITAAGARYEPLTNGDVDDPELIFADGDVIMVEVYP